MTPTNEKVGNPYGYLKGLASACALMLLVLLAVIVIIDPYGLYRIVDMQGFNHIKPGLSRYHEQIKLEHAIHKRTTNVILGNSRAEIGFDPSSSVLKDITPRFYNLAVPGSSLATGLRQLHALNGEGTKLQNVIIGVEFLDFLDSPAHVNPPLVAKEKLPLTFGLESLKWKFDALFSLTTVKDTWKTVRIQNDAEAETITGDGYNPLNEYKRFVRMDGYRAIFQQRAVENAANYVKKSESVLSDGEFSVLAAVLDESGKSKTRTVLIIYPYHAQIMFMFERAGLSPLFSEWKKRLALMVGEANKKRPDNVIELFDFSGFGITCTFIRGNDTRISESPLYWEAGHFKKAMGDMVLSNVFDRFAISANISGILAGSKIISDANEEGFEKNAKRLREERANCIDKAPKLLEGANKMIDLALRQKLPLSH
jgi:hypothetical protein